MTNPLFPDIVVNGTTLSAASIAAEAQNHPAPQGKPGLAWRRAARALAIRQLLLEQADRLEIAAAPRELAPGKLETDDEARIREVLDQVIDPAPVTEADLCALYDRDPGRYRAPTLYQPAHILFAAPAGEDAQRAAARQQAGEVLSQLRQSPRRFGDLAAKHSACSSRDVGGQLGQLSSGDTVPEFEAAMDAAPVGDVYDTPVETRYGLHILRMDARAEGDLLPFAAVRGRLREACEKANWARAAQVYVVGLLDEARISGMDLQQVA